MTDLDPTPFRLLLDRVIEPARRNFRRLFLPIAIPFAIFGLAATVFQLGWVRTLTGSGDFGQMVPMFGGMAVSIVAVVLVYGFGFCALYVGSLDAAAGRPVEMRRAWLFVFKPPVFLTLLLVAVANFLSLMCCLLPALYVTPTLAYTPAVMVEEQRYGWEAIRRSAEIAHHNPTGRAADSAWLQTVVLLLVGMVINYAVSFTIQVPFAVAQQILVLREAASGQAGEAAMMVGVLWLQAPAQLLSAFATAATWMYWTFGLSLLYRETRRRKEAGDLTRAVDELTGVGGVSGSASAAPVS